MVDASIGRRDVDLNANLKQSKNHRSNTNHSGDDIKDPGPCGLGASLVVEYAREDKHKGIQATLPTNETNLSRLRP